MPFNCFLLLCIESWSVLWVVAFKLCGASWLLFGLSVLVILKTSLGVEISVKFILI